MHVALLRGVNVGGKNILPMKALAEIFEKAGAHDVQTFIQSGNVVFDASTALARKIPEVVGAAIERRFGFRPALALRTAAELAAVARENPFLAPKVDLKALHVGFLVELPSAARVATLDPARSPPDVFEVRGREVYFHFPAGLGRSKLTSAYFDGKLATTITVGNWATVMKLVELAAG